MNRILLVEDDKEISTMLKKFLTAENFEITTAPDGKRACEEFFAGNFSLVLLDLMIPELNGMEVMEKIREKSTVPIIILSAKDTDSDKTLGLGLGADDYITKPFGTLELLARIRASLRHSNRMDSNSALYIRPYQCQGLLLDFDKRMLTLNGEEIHLTQIEYKIVAFLARNSGKVMTYSAIMSSVWGPFTGDNNRILRVNMANIRRKIEQNPSQPQFLFTEVGVGYRMREDENEL